MCKVMYVPCHDSSCGLFISRTDNPDPFVSLLQAHPALCTPAAPLQRASKTQPLTVSNVRTLNTVQPGRWLGASSAARITLTARPAAEFAHLPWRSIPWTDTWS